MNNNNEQYTYSSNEIASSEIFSGKIFSTWEECDLFLDKWSKKNGFRINKYRVNRTF